MAKARREEKRMGSGMVFVLRNDKRRERVGIEQIGHPSFRIAATSSVLMVRPSLQASGTPLRIFGAPFPFRGVRRISIFKGVFTGRFTGSSGTITLPSKCALSVTGMTLRCIA